MNISKAILVVKLGSSVLTAGSLKLDHFSMRAIACQCAKLHKEGFKIIIVSSGAIAAGRELLNDYKDEDIINKQILAAVGQSQLIRQWQKLFDSFDIKIGQMLLTKADLDHKERFLNAKDLLKGLLKRGIIPVINENDAVATAEIKVGDNDNLSALVAILASANKLFLLSDQEGLYSDDPRQNPKAKLIKEVEEINDYILSIAGSSKGSLGTGGMATKIEAAKIACRSGIEVIIAAGAKTDIIIKLAKNEAEGTRFIAKSTALQNRKRWILSASKNKGSLYIDEGALKALKKGASLLASGIVEVKEGFKRGEIVQILNKDKGLVARGISAYKSEDLAKIAGKHSKQIFSILGYEYTQTAIHRDDLIML